MLKKVKHSISKLMEAKINRKGDKTSKFILLYQYTKIKNTAQYQIYKCTEVRKKEIFKIIKYLLLILPEW